MRLEPGTSVQNGSSATPSENGTTASHDSEAPAVVHASPLVDTPAAAGHNGNGAHPVGEYGVAESPAIDVVGGPNAHAVSEAIGRGRGEKPHPVFATLETVEEDDDVINVEAVAVPAGAMNAVTKHVRGLARSRRSRELDGP